MKRIDGHTHTELCPHGSQQSMRQMIERAIQLGFDEYWITEHAPLPSGFIKYFAGPEDDWRSEGLSFSQVDDYLKLARSLQSEYADQLKIQIGFEIEYLPGFETATRDFLNQYGPQTQQNILSVHYLTDDDGYFWGIDYSPEELKAGFGQELAVPQRLYARYLKTVLASARSDLGPYMPQKLGHISLIQKYRDYFNLPERFDQTNLAIIDQIMITAKKRGLILDFNSAGIFKKYCHDFYPGPQITQAAIKHDVPLMFGSDAHAIDEVGRGWHLLENYKNILDRLENEE